MQISVVIITYNEESKIEGALKSVQEIADEIIEREKITFISLIPTQYNLILNTT